LKRAIGEIGRLRRLNFDRASASRVGGGGVRRRGRERGRDDQDT
jgi:hypothetical protein